MALYKQRAFQGQVKTMETSTQDQQSASQPAADIAAQPTTQAPTSPVQATAPGQLKVIKRNGSVVPYTDEKIIVAITKAFLAVEGAAAAASGRIHETVHALSMPRLAMFSSVVCPLAALSILRIFRTR